MLYCINNVYQKENPYYILCCIKTMGQRVEVTLCTGYLCFVVFVIFMVYNLQCILLYAVSI